MPGAFGASPLAVWAIKHVVSPVQRWTYRATGGLAFRWGRLNRSILLLTTTGRRSGQSRTVPVFFLHEGDGFVVCNVKPVAERTNPWVLNLRANPVATVQLGRDVLACRARELHGAELDRVWTQLIALWPAYGAHYARSGARAVFVLTPDDGSTVGPGVPAD